MSYNGLEGDVVGILLNVIRSSSSMATLKTIKMKGVNWDDQEAQHELVRLLAEAPSL